MDPRFLSIEDFRYDLPVERIARYPLAQRDESRLLIWENGAISESSYAALAAHLPEGCLLVFNNTKVVEARLLFQKAGGSRIEVFCLEPADSYADITTAMLQRGSVVWKCLVGGAKKWKEGSLLMEVGEGTNSTTLSASKLQRNSDHYLIELSWNNNALSFAEVLHLAGAIPLPPYLERAAEEADKERYQTIYARHDGSVAAPTAGLHFTDRVFNSLTKKNITASFVTLHVGAGTFKPVKASIMQEHEMHAEFIEVSRGFIEQLRSQLATKVIAVGTTSLRTLESLYWLGCKVAADPHIPSDQLHLSQWEPYEMNASPATADALTSLLNWMEKNSLTKLLAKTQIIVAPGYQFRVIDGLITNFHQPQSTLLLLVSAITGEEWRKIYDHAMANAYRFLSYGDGSLLWVPQDKMKKIT